MNTRHVALSMMMVIIIIMAGCTRQSPPATEIRHFPVNSIDKIITKTGVQIDEVISTDGNGSLRVDSTGSVVVRLFEINNIDIENTRLTYQAKLKTEGMDGRVYIEMWCGFTGKGEFFSRSLQSPLTGTTDWTTVETPFFLEKGQNPDLVRLNLVVDGKGTAWIDDIRLLKGPLN